MTNQASQPLYSLKIAASQVGLSPRTLRLYEEAGLIAPARTGGNDQRLYSDQDLHWLRCIRDMIHGEKLTVPAIRRLLDLIPCWELRHCAPQQAAACAAGLNIPDMARKGGHATAETAPESAEGGSDAGVVLRLIYGVKEFGAVLPCSRCTHAERVLHKVAAQFDDSVLVEKMDIASEEAAQYGVLLPPAVLVDDELLASGQGVSEGRLQKAVQEHLKKAQ
ncbi:MAG: MerR family transcriptional regulator [Bacteroidota bacterium]